MASAKIAPQGPKRTSLRNVKVRNHHSLSKKNKKLSFETLFVNLLQKSHKNLQELQLFHVRYIHYYEQFKHQSFIETNNSLG